MCVFIDLPKDAHLHDLTSLMAIDSTKLNPEELGEDIMKEQQAANLKHSSSACAIIPEDRAQTMLAGVRPKFAFGRATHFFCIFRASERDLLRLSFYCRRYKCCKFRGCWKRLPTLRNRPPFPYIV